MEDALKAVGQYGFPMVIAMYLLIRIEKRMTELTQAITSICEMCEKVISKN
jgi:hypothetical protein